MCVGRYAGWHAGRRTGRTVSGVLDGAPERCTGGVPGLVDVHGIVECDCLLKSKGLSPFI
eukprot:351253-Chlamydomonas_euryale.AAC.5